MTELSDKIYNIFKNEYKDITQIKMFDENINDDWSGKTIFLDLSEEQHCSSFSYEKYLIKAVKETIFYSCMKKNTRVIYIVPMLTHKEWFHKYILDQAKTIYILVNSTEPLAIIEFNNITPTDFSEPCLISLDVDEIK